MYKGNCVLILVFCLAGCGWATSGPTSPVGDSKLLQLMRATRDEQLSNPTRSLECFHYYSELFEQYFNEYEEEYAKCQLEASKSIEGFDDAFKPELNSLNSSVVESCRRLSICPYAGSTLFSFACYSNVSPDVAKVMNNIAANASTYYAQLLFQYDFVKFEEDTCTNSSRRRYDERTDVAYEDFQRCLLGESSVPSIGPTSTTQASTATNQPSSTISITEPPADAPTAPTVAPPTTKLSQPTWDNSVGVLKRNLGKEIANILN